MTPEKRKHMEETLEKLSKLSDGLIDEIGDWQSKKTETLMVDLNDSEINVVMARALIIVAYGTLATLPDHIRNLVISEGEDFMKYCIECGIAEIKQ